MVPDIASLTPHSSSPPPSDAGLSGVSGGDAPDQPTVRASLQVRQPSCIFSEANNILQTLTKDDLKDWIKKMGLKGANLRTKDGMYMSPTAQSFTNLPADFINVIVEAPMAQQPSQADVDAMLTDVCILSYISSYLQAITYAFYAQRKARKDARRVVKV